MAQESRDGIIGIKPFCQEIKSNSSDDGDGGKQPLQMTVTDERQEIGFGIKSKVGSMTIERTSQKREEHRRQQRKQKQNHILSLPLSLYPHCMSSLASTPTHTPTPTLSLQVLSIPLESVEREFAILIFSLLE